MITFTDFASRLARGQLKNIAAVDDTNLGEISPDYIDSILELTNQGLDDLFTRLVLIKKLIDLTFLPNQNLYAMLDDNLGATPPDYLDVTGLDSFVEREFVKFLEFYDDTGKRYTINTDGHIITPTYNTIRFTTDKITELSVTVPKIRIQYQARHKLIVENDTIDIPPNLVTALQLFVASLYISHMNGKEHSQKGDRYFAAYLRHIGEDEARDISSTSEVEEDNRFIERGFV